MKVLKYYYLLKQIMLRGTFILLSHSNDKRKYTKFYFTRK